MSARRRLRRRWWFAVPALLLLLLAGLVLLEGRRLERRSEALVERAGKLPLGQAYRGRRFPGLPLSDDRAAAWDVLLERLEFRIAASQRGERHVLAPVLDREWARVVERGELRVEDAQLAAFLDRHSGELDELASFLAEPPAPNWCARQWPPPRVAHEDLQLLLRLSVVAKLQAGEPAGAERVLEAAWLAREAYDRGCYPAPGEVTRGQLEELLWLLRRVPLEGTDWLDRLELSRPWKHQVFVLRRELEIGLRMLRQGRAWRLASGDHLPAAQRVLWGDLLPASWSQHVQLPWQRRCLLAELEPSFGAVAAIGEEAPCGLDPAALEAARWTPPEPEPGCLPATYSRRLGQLAEAFTLQAHADLTELALRMQLRCSDRRDVSELVYCWNRVRVRAACPDDWVLQARAGGGFEIAHARPERLLPSTLATTLRLEPSRPSR